MPQYSFWVENGQTFLHEAGVPLRGQEAAREYTIGLASRFFASRKKHDGLHGCVIHAQQDSGEAFSMSLSQAALQERDALRALAGLHLIHN
jgi:hypothetical protein